MPYTKKQQYRIDNGLCFKCGKASEGHWFCAECNENRKIQRNQTDDYYKKIGYCHKCHKNKLFADEKNCLECRAESANWMMNNRKYNKEYAVNYQKVRRENFIKNGLCPRCGRKPLQGKRTCQKCLDSFSHNRLMKKFEV